MDVGPVNLLALKGLANLRKAQDAIHTAAERIATGKRINRGKDDPSGLIAAESLAARQRDLAGQIKAAERASDILNVAEGSLAVIQDLLVNLNGLAVAAANTGALSAAEKASNQLEADSILQALDYIASTTTFNNDRILAHGVNLVIGDSSFTFAGINVAGLGLINAQITRPGPNPGDPDITEHASFTLKDIAAGGALNFITGNTEIAQKVVASAITSVSGLRAQVGAYQRFTLGAHVNAKSAELENTAAAESSIRDADIAQEIVDLFRARILEQTSLSAIGLAGDVFRNRALAVFA